MFKSLSISFKLRLLLSWKILQQIVEMFILSQIIC